MDQISRGLLVIRIFPASKNATSVSLSQCQDINADQGVLTPLTLVLLETNTRST